MKRIASLALYLANIPRACVAADASRHTYVRTRKTAPTDVGGYSLLRKVPKQMIAGLAVVGLTWLASIPASALIMSGRGNQEVRDAGWPEGALALANFESRIGWWEGPPFGGGEWHFLFCGNTEGFNDALALFAAIRAPALNVVLHDGPYEDSLLKERVDWAFTVWVPANWHRLFNNPKSVFEANHSHFRQPVDPPRLDVYVGGGGGVDWAKVKVPVGISVRDERAAAAAQPVGGAMVRADIYDMATGKPVRDAQVAVVRTWNAGAYIAYEDVAKAVSDPAGQAEFTNIPAGTYGLKAGADGYATRVLSYERCGRGSSKRLTVELAKSAVFSGRVTDMDGDPLQEVKVYPSTVMAMDGRGYTSPGQLTVETDAGGRFELAGLPVGYVQVGARKEGYHFSDLFTIHDAPATNIVLRLSRAGGLQVTVTDKAGQRLSRFEGNPLMVEVEPKEGNKVGSWGGSATVKDDGTVEFKNIPPGQYRIESRPNPSHSNRQYAPEQLITVTAGGPPIQVKVVYE